LQDKPLQLLCLLLEQPNILLTREQIIERLWGSSRYHHCADSLNQCVRKLRQALEDHASDSQILETIPRRGYRLVAPVQALSPSGAASGTAVQPLGAGHDGVEHAPCPRPFIQATFGVRIVGREAELSALRASWKATLNGAQQFAILSGEPGVGKTSLAAVFAQSLSREALVLLGRCEQERPVPYGPFAEILRLLVESFPPAVLQEQLASIEGSDELKQLTPAVARYLGSEPETLPAGPVERRYRMFDAFKDLLHAVAGNRPVLLVLEDMHWSEPGTVLLLRHLVRSMKDCALFILITMSDTELPDEHSTRELWASVRREPSATRVVLRGLDEEHVGSLVNTFTGINASTTSARAVRESTGGNPLYVTEILRHLVETDGVVRLKHLSATASIEDLGVPESLRELIAIRASKLGPECSRLLTLAAVVGRKFGLTVLEALVNLSEDELFHCIDNAVKARIIHEVPSQPGRFVFTHGIVRQAFYSNQTEARRVRLHHKVGEVLERLSGEEPAAADLAFHFGRAAAFRDADKAIRYAIRAAEDAAGQMALEEAARHYGMALRALEHVQSHSPFASPDQRVHLLTERGRSFLQAGQWMSARQEFVQALSVLESRSDTETTRCELYISLAECAFWLMDVGAVRDYAGRAQSLADLLNRDDLAANALAWIASAQAADGDVTRAVETDRRAISRSDAIQSFARARMPLTLYWAGLTARAVEQGAETVTYARETRDPAFLLYSLQHSGLALSGAGQYSEALELFDEACTLGRRCGALPLLARAICMSVAPLFSLGDFQTARRRALQARELASQIDFEPPFVSAGIDLLLISARSGDLSSAGSLLDELTPAVHKASGWHGWKWQMRLSQARAELALAHGEWKDARDAASEVVHRSDSHGRLKYQALGRATRSRALAQLGSGQALLDARTAVSSAGRLQDPAVLLECLVALLELDPDPKLFQQAKSLIFRMSENLPDDGLRSRYLLAASNKLAAASDSTVSLGDPA
ncbi:MAG TPA: AAA family ATPase, partial [Bryobacteraceae bacterium]|nr:AAA family ATPase [Bryobacteraceae bacterium]